MRQKKQKKFNFMGYLIIFFMVSSIFGVMFYGYNDGSQDYRYGDYKFKVVNQRLVTDVDGKDVQFYFLPQDVLTLNVSEEISAKVKDAQAYIMMFDPDDENLPYIELFRLELAELGMNGVTSKFFVPAMTKESDVYSFDILSCDNATAFQPIVYFYTGDETGVTMENNCIKLSGAYSNDLALLRDWLVFTITDII